MVANKDAEGLDLRENWRQKLKRKQGECQGNQKAKMRNTHRIEVQRKWQTRESEGRERQTGIKGGSPMGGHTGKLDKDNHFEWCVSAPCASVSLGVKCGEGWLGEALVRSMPYEVAASTAGFQTTWIDVQELCLAHRRPYHLSPNWVTSESEGKKYYLLYTCTSTAGQIGTLHVHT